MFQRCIEDVLKGSRVVFGVFKIPLDFLDLRVDFSSLPMCNLDAAVRARRHFLVVGGYLMRFLPLQFSDLENNQHRAVLRTRNYFLSPSCRRMCRVRCSFRLVANPA